MSKDMQAQRLGTVGTTERGFPVVRFQDAYLERCCLQMSSAINANAEVMPLPGESFVWLGVDQVQPTILAKEAAAAGVHTAETTGWVPYPVPENVLLNGRMHLSRVQVAGLIERLQQWLETGGFDDGPPW